MFLPVIFGIHSCYIGWCVAAGSFFWTAIPIMEETEHIRGAGDRSSKQFDFH